MTIRKTFPPCNYETFPSDNASDAGPATPHSHATSDSQKTVSAAQEAQRLATQGSWGDNYINGTPMTNATPTASTVDEQEDRYGDSRYPAEPPPMYTPTDTTPTSPSRPSPTTTTTTTRSEPWPVRQLISPSHPPPPPAAEPEPDDEEDPPVPGAYTPSSPLLEQQPTYHYRNIKRCKSQRRRRGCCRRACWFVFALALCLWLMAPSLCNWDKAGTRAPRPTKDPLSTTPIPTWPEPSRSYRRHETSNSIHGTFQLHDLLDLSTTSGSISITVNPQPGDKSAALRLATYSGSITVNMGDDSWRWGRLPHSVSSNRTFQTNISTKSGGVDGSVLHGNGGTTDISTKSGSISITINAVGVGKDDEVSKLITTTSSGSQTIKVTSSDAIRAIEASHIVRGSGRLDVAYGVNWEGTVHAKSRGSGSVNVDGSGLEFQGGGRDVYAKRGKGELRGIEVIGRGSGSVDFRC